MASRKHFSAAMRSGSTSDPLARGASGANFAFPAADVEGSRSAFEGARLALFQFETPLPTVAGALKLARDLGAMTILDPAPAQRLSPELVGLVDILTPNEMEAANIEYGLHIASEIARLDLGQTIVVRAAACVAIEAMEGTDATIKRAGKLANGKEL